MKELTHFESLRKYRISMGVKRDGVRGSRWWAIRESAANEEVSKRSERAKAISSKNWTLFSENRTKKLIYLDGLWQFFVRY